jgi:hypothetical protein
MAMSKRQWGAYWAWVSQRLAAAPRANLDRDLARAMKRLREALERLH